MSFELKYLKYKSKYLELKNQLGGNPADYYFHGTNSAYLPYIKSGGLGIFHEELYQRIKYIYDIGITIASKLNNESTFSSFEDIFVSQHPWYDPSSKSAPKYVYYDKLIRSFIEDQIAFRRNHTFKTWFTSDIEQAKRYGTGENSIGNLLSSFLDQLKAWIEKNKSDASKASDLHRAIELKQILEPEDQRQIILAIRRDSIRAEDISDTQGYAISIRRLIRPEEIYLYNLESNTFTSI